MIDLLTESPPKNHPSRPLQVHIAPETVKDGLRGSKFLPKKIFFVEVCLGTLPANSTEPVKRLRYTVPNAHSKPQALTATPSQGPVSRLDNHKKQARSPAWRGAMHRISEPDHGDERASHLEAVQRRRRFSIPPTCRRLSLYLQAHRGLMQPDSIQSATANPKVQKTSYRQLQDKPAESLESWPLGLENISLVL